MPSLRVHRYIDLLFFQKSYYKIHREMDRPVKYFGRTHRDLFHDIPSAYFIARKHYPNDPNAEWAAYYHIHFDEVCSSDPEFKKLLEKLAKQASRKKRKKKGPSKLPHVVDLRLLKIMELWVLLQRLQSTAEMTPARA